MQWPKEKTRISRKLLGKYFYDLSKGSFMVMVIGNAATLITEQNFTLYNVALVIMGLFLTWVLAYFANFIFIKGNSMEALVFTYAVLCVCAAGMLIWIRSPKGRDWVKHLDD